MKRCLWALGTILCTLMASPVTAEEAGVLNLTRDLIMAQRDRIVTETMQLDAREAELFWPLFQGYREDMGRLNERQLQLLERYVRQYDSITDSQATQLMDRWLDLEGEAVKLRRAWVRRFNRQLPARLTFRFFQLVQRMDTVIRAELGQVLPLLR